MRMPHACHLVILSWGVQGSVQACIAFTDPRWARGGPKLALHGQARMLQYGWWSIVWLSALLLLSSPPAPSDSLACCGLERVGGHDSQVIQTGRNFCICAHLQNAFATRSVKEILVDCQHDMMASACLQVEAVRMKYLQAYALGLLGRCGEGGCPTADLGWILSGEGPDQLSLHAASPK